MKKHNELESAYDVIARNWKGEVVFTPETDKGKQWILRNWGSVEFGTNSLKNSAIWVRKMNNDGLEVALLFGV